MMRMPYMYKHYHQTPLENVYKAMSDKDLSECVIAAMKVLKDSNHFISLDNKVKSVSEAIRLGDEGKNALNKGDYAEAMTKYNSALMQAPQDSDAMRITYFNRAKLLFLTKEFTACLKDIETCLSMNCSGYMMKELLNMKAGASQCIRIDTFRITVKESPIANKLYKIKGDRNPDIPCASAAIKVILEERQQPKVVAAKDIPVGTVLALEPAFVAISNLKDCLISCHYCYKFNLNLIPCEGCCAALFCNNDCREQAMREGHNIECKIMNAFSLEDPYVTLPPKVVLKMRQMCKTWDEFISASHEFGVDRVRTSSIAKIFGPDKFALLNCHDERHFIHGAMFNSCMYFANVIHYLDTNTSFLPTSAEEKNAAIRAMSRIMMYLSLYSVPVMMDYYTYEVDHKINIYKHINNGYFPFIGKLGRACLANCSVMGMRRSAALVTIMPIKQGSELTIPFYTYWLEKEDGKYRRAKKIYLLCHTVCSCIICSGEEILNKEVLTDIQKEAFVQFFKDKTVISFPKEFQSTYVKVCKTLQLLSNAPYSEAYLKVFNVFISCLIISMDCQYPNAVLSA